MSLPSPRSARSRLDSAACHPARAATTILAAVIASALSATAGAQQPGAIRGVVLDVDFDVALPGVRVGVVETGQAATTTPDGFYVVEDVVPGTYTLSFTKPGYRREVVPEVGVVPGRLTELDVGLTAEVVEMDELVVTGADFLASSEIGQLELRAEAFTLQDAISSELIGKAGVGDVAGALKLVVGASVVEGKYATVRGLSDRYTGTTLNGIRVPSADPRRRAVQVDLFPTGTVESVTVTKTFTPDLQGDFTGGGVDIQTKSIPEERILSLKASVEHDSLATGNDELLTYRGGGVESLAVSGEDRELPEGATELPSNPTRPVTDPTPEQLEQARRFDAVTKSFAPAMGVTERSAGPNFGFSGVAGDRWELGEQAVLGALGAITYKRTSSFYEDGVNNNAVRSDPSQPISVKKPRSDSKGAESVLIGSLGTVVLRPSEDHEYAARLVLNQSAEDEARLQVQDPDEVSVERNQTLHYTERTVGSLQLHGEHGWSTKPWMRRFLRLDESTPQALTLDWRTALNFTKQYEPDVRFFRNTFNRGTQTGERPANSTDPQNTRRIWRDIDERNHQLALDFGAKFRQWTDSEGLLKAGIFVDRSERDFTQDSFTYEFVEQVGGVFDPVVRENADKARFSAESPDQLWTDVFSQPGRLGIASNDPPAGNQLLWVLRPVRDDVDYEGEQSIDAAYAMVRLPLTRRLELIAGARLEETDISIVPFGDGGVVEVIRRNPSGERFIDRVPNAEAATSITESSLLPAVGVVLDLPRNQKVRASWSRTIARPTFRELAPVATEEFIFGDEFVGNAALELSRITNYDLRWEWFRRPGEVLAVSAFYKEIRDPIELLSFAVSNRVFVQPVNFERGTLLGLELEGRTALDVLGPWDWLGNLTLGVNFTLLETDVEVLPFEQESLTDFGLSEEARRLQGQPEYLLNVNLSWDDEARGWSAGLFYNVVGETLVTGAARGVEDGNPNVFETAFESLDLNVKKTLGEQLSLSFKAKNLLTPDDESIYRTPDGLEEVKSRHATALRLSVSASFEW